MKISVFYLPYKIIIIFLNQNTNLSVINFAKNSTKQLQVQKLIKQLQVQKITQLNNFIIQIKIFTLAKVN